MTRVPSSDPDESEHSKKSLRGLLSLALALSLGPAVTLGLDRFAYALLLPAMKNDLEWSYALAGGMNTANAVGYLLGALLAAPAISRLGSRQAFAGGLLVTSLVLLTSSLPSAYTSLIALRLAAGVVGAIAFVAGSVLAAHAASDRPDRVALVLGVYYGGGGLGIFLSALGVPALLELGPVDPAAWRLGWIGLGVASLLALAVAGVAVYRMPEPSTSPTEAGEGWSARPLFPAFVAYFLFGSGYIAYMTFVIAFLRVRGAGALEVSLFWAVLGVVAFASTPAWGPIIERLRGGRALAVVLVVVAAGATLPLISDAPVPMFASAALFGGSFLAVVTAVMALARKSFPAYAWSAGIAALTTTFAVGQCLGPIVSGILSDRSGGLEAGLTLSAGMLIVAVLAALTQREVSPG